MANPPPVPASPLCGTGADAAGIVFGVTDSVSVFDGLEDDVAETFFDAGVVD